MIVPTLGAVPVTPLVVTANRAATTAEVLTGSLNVTVNGSVVAFVGEVPAMLIALTVGAALSIVKVLLAGVVWTLLDVSIACDSTE